MSTTLSIRDNVPVINVRDTRLYRTDADAAPYLEALDESKIEELYESAREDFWSLVAPAVAREHGYSGQVYSYGRSGGWLGIPDAGGFLDYVEPDADGRTREPFPIPEPDYPEPPAGWAPQYDHWRHGGWYVTNVRYSSGACGCVSRNYTDRKWRIVCDPRPGWPMCAPEQGSDHTYPNRDAAARAELGIAKADSADTFAAMIERDHFLRFAAAIEAAVKAAQDDYVDRLREACGELERRREAAIVRSEN